MNITSSMAANKAKKIRFYSKLLFLIYILFLCYFLFFSENMGRTTDCEYKYNLVLFHEINRFIRYAHLLGWKAVLINIFGNVIAFMPFGYFVPIIVKNKKIGIIRTTFLSMIFSLEVETVQLIFRLGCFDVDDILLNTLGGMFGFILYYLVYGRKNKDAKKEA